jgi:hypothetical protein
MPCEPGAVGVHFVLPGKRVGSFGGCFTCTTVAALAWRCQCPGCLLGSADSDGYCIFVTCTACALQELWNCLAVHHEASSVLAYGVILGRVPY